MFDVIMMDINSPNKQTENRNMSDNIAIKNTGL